MAGGFDAMGAEFSKLSSWMIVSQHWQQRCPACTCTRCSVYHHTPAAARRMSRHSALPHAHSPWAGAGSSRTGSCSSRLPAGRAQ